LSSSAKIKENPRIRRLVSSLVLGNSGTHAPELTRARVTISARKLAKLQRKVKTSVFQHAISCWRCPLRRVA